MAFEGFGANRASGNSRGNSRGTGEYTVPLLTRNGGPVVVRRSARRTRTVSANWEGGTAVVSIPASFTASQESEWVRKMLAKLESRVQRRSRTTRSDTALMARSMALSQKYLQGRAVPESVRWVGNQNSRWGSCTPSLRTIRISDKLEGMPDYVVDYVLLHELTHLLVSGHGPRFWAELQAYPQLERAKAFLDGAAHAASRGLKGTGLDAADEDESDENEPGEAEPNDDESGEAGPDLNKPGEDNWNPAF